MATVYVISAWRLAAMNLEQILGVFRNVLSRGKEVPLSERRKVEEAILKVAQERPEEKHKQKFIQDVLAVAEPECSLAIRLRGLLEG